jgi:hypothetical protein
MYHDFFLKFTDADEANAALFDDERPKYAAIDVIGTIYKPTGDTLMTSEGPVPEMAPIDGWHVNVRHTAEASELKAYRVFPATPSRSWL